MHVAPPNGWNSGHAFYLRCADNIPTQLLCKVLGLVVQEQARGVVPVEGRCHEKGGYRVIAVVEAVRTKVMVSSKSSSGQAGGETGSMFVPSTSSIIPQVQVHVVILTMLHHQYRGGP